MLNIEITDIGADNIPTIINKLFDDYYKSIK
jgi:hypothetical protein